MDGSFNAAIPYILIGLVALVLAVWLLRRVSQSTTVIRDESAQGDVLDEGAAPARRNQALIDAAPAAVNVAPEPGPTPAPEPELTPAPGPEPAPKPAPSPKPAPASDGADDLSQIKGVGPKLVALLKAEGVTSFAQIAAWSDSDIEAIDAKLGRFSGRIARDQWVDQAKLLISQDKSAFSEKFGNNG
ncbi:MAG: hypothetical protein AAF650_06905 [Pseudomonadota bacterium]